MTDRVVLEPAFVLHTFPYSNTSLIVDVFSMRYGRVSVMARSARGPKSRYKGKLQLFSPMIISWSGRRELKTLGALELNGKPYQLESNALLCGFYINELLVRLLQRDDPYPKIFEHYQQVLNALEQSSDSLYLQTALRCFEKNILERLGYGLPLHRDAQTGEPLQESKWYQYVPERGFLCCDPIIHDAFIFSGRSLLALHQENFSDKQTLKDSKRLLRLALSRHLGQKPLKSRDLMR